jgi:hypothetical protein
VNPVLAWLKRRPLVDLAAVRKLQVEPGDVLVITTPQRLAPEERAGLLRAWDSAKLLPGVRVMILEAGMDVAVISPPPKAP